MPSKTGAKKAKSAQPKAQQDQPQAIDSKPQASASRPIATVIATPRQVVAIDHEQVRRRAYELYLQRGCQDGFHEQDWLQAETELRGRTA